MLFNVKNRNILRARPHSKQKLGKKRACDAWFSFYSLHCSPEHVFYAKITQIRGPEELKQPKMVYFGGSWSLLFNNKLNVKTQELNVSLLLLKSLSLLTFNANTR